MSKGKNNNKNNKAAKVPVKVQPMKQQKPAVVKNVQKTISKPAKVEIIKKEVAKKDLKVVKGKDIKTKKQLDLEESCDDEDESDVDSEIEMDDSDMDDVDLEDSDDLEGDSDDDDISIEDMDNSDFESIELGEGEDDDSEGSEEEEPVAKKVEVKGTKKVEPKTEKKVEPKTEKKVETKADKKQNVPEQVKSVNSDSEKSKILTEVNKRKNFLNNCVVFINKVHSTVTRDSLLKVIGEKVKVINVNIPTKKSGKKKSARGYGFIRVANAEESTKVIALLNGKEFGGVKMGASKFVCKKVYDDVSKLDMNKIIVLSSVNEDITENLKSHFNTNVSKTFNTQYFLEFSNEEEASALFKKEKMNLDGKELYFNYYYQMKPQVQNPVEKAAEPVAEKVAKVTEKASEVVAKVAEKVAEPVAKVVEKVAKPVTPIVKAGIKRKNVDSDEEGDVKKTKVETTPKKAIAVAKKPVAKTPEVKEDKKVANKSPNSNKKPAGKSPVANKKQANQSPAANKKQANQSPAANKQQNGKKSPGNKKPFNKK